MVCWFIGLFVYLGYLGSAAGAGLLTCDCALLRKPENHIRSLTFGTDWYEKPNAQSELRCHGTLN